MVTTATWTGGAPCEKLWLLFYYENVVSRCSTNQVADTYSGYLGTYMHPFFSIPIFPLLSMEQTKADLWALKTTPTVTSFFRLLLVDGHSPEIVKAPVTTGRCGLGWSFIFQAMNGDTNETLWGGTTTARQTLFTISLLATYHISSLDKLLVNVEADNSETKLHVSEISLSDFKARPFVSILSPANFTGNITIEIHVGLPKTFSLMGDPSGGAKQRLHRSLAQSLLSGGLGDVRFALFTCGREDGEVKPPKILYASSSLIRGYSAFIDNRMYSGAFHTALAHVLFSIIRHRRTRSGDCW